MRALFGFGGHPSAEAMISAYLKQREAIRTAHQQAMHEALALIEDHAAYTRTGAGGIAQIATRGLIAAVFEHWDAGPAGQSRHPAGQKPPRSLADKRAAWRAELDARFGAGAAARLMAAVPDSPPLRQSPDHPAAPDLHDLAERTVAAVSARRPVWTVWNVRAEAERLLRAEVPVLEPGRHRELADTITALAISPEFSISVEAPALRDLTRTRLQFVRDRTREWQRLEKLLEGALVKLSSAVWSLTAGIDGWHACLSSVSATADPTSVTDSDRMSRYRVRYPPFCVSPAVAGRGWLGAQNWVFCLRTHRLLDRAGRCRAAVARAAKAAAAPPRQ